MPGRVALSYLLPLRRERPEQAEIEELAGYAGWLASVVEEVLVLDGSPSGVFTAHHRLLPSSVTHLAPDPRYHFANGKVDGVLTGLELAHHEKVVIADDDVRWDEPGLRRAAAFLNAADVVRPQNYFDPLPWHARWDTARSLLNRAFGADYPGTLAVRRSALLATGGYDGDAMFENLELMRTVRVAGGTVHSAPDLHVRRLPPSVRQFRQQRIRQAYDDFAQPVRLVASLAVLPAVATAALRRRAWPVAGGVLLSIAVAERGRRRAGGRAVFPPTTPLFAPLWVLERAVCSWLAVGSWVLWGGCRYRGRVMRLAATPVKVLRMRHLDGRGKDGCGGQPSRDTGPARSVTLAR